MPGIHLNRGTARRGLTYLKKFADDLNYNTDPDYTRRQGPPVFFVLLPDVVDCVNRSDNHIPITRNVASHATLRGLYLQQKRPLKV